MASKAQEISRADMSAEIRSLQEGFYEDWVSGSLPEIWNEIPVLNPTKPAKTKITLRFDADMIAWFRKLGTGYQGRMNSILRVYWHSLLSGRIKAHWDAEAVAPNEHSFLEDLLTKRVEQIRCGEVSDVSESELATMEAELVESLQIIQKVPAKQALETAK
jgi:uncharacterized protein (DUF4415 family)